MGPAFAAAHLLIGMKGIVVASAGFSVARI